MHQQLDRCAYGGPRVRFSGEEVDQARAAGVTLEFERCAPLIVDRSLYRELVKQAIARTVTELEAQVARARRRAQRGPAGRRITAGTLTRSPTPTARSAKRCARPASRRTVSTSTSVPAC